MPRNLMKYGFTEMESTIPQNGILHDFKPIPNSKGCTLEDENLKYLSTEELNALLFFEETLKSFQDDLPVNGDASPRLEDQNASSDSEPEDIIDLVLAAQESSEQKEEPVQGIVVSCDDKEPEQKERPLMKSSPPAVHPHQPTMDPSRSKNMHSTENPVDRQKLLGGVPTPIIIAEQISKKTIDNGNLSPSSPKGDKLVEKRRNAATSPPPGHTDYFSYPSPSSRISHFPNNIVIHSAGKGNITTISKANVNVQQRRAQVLANLHPESLTVEEVEERMRHSHMIGRDRSASFRDGAAHQAKYEALIKLELIKETPVQSEPPAEVEIGQATNAHMLQYSPTKPLTNGIDNINKVLSSERSPFIPSGKTVTIPGGTSGATSPTEKQFIHRSPSQSIHEPSRARHQNDIQRTSSLPRPAGLRSHGVSVKFSGRGATEESKNEALRQLGLLK